MPTFAAMKIGILTAMTSEHDQLAALLEDKVEIHSGHFTYTMGRCGHNDIILRQCGIGKVNAAIGTTELIRSFSPQCVISTGVAGGIDSRLAIMDVVVGQQTCYHDVWCGMGCEYGQIQGQPTYFKGNPLLVDHALSLDTPTTIHAGLICTGDQFITAQRELEKIKRMFPDGLACDMESAAIAQTCHIFNVPFVSFRIISDTPGIKEHSEQWDNFWTDIADRSFHVTKTYLETLPN